MSLSAENATSERRSAADLQRILDSLIGDAGYVLAGNLPDVLAAYEKEHDLVILDPSEYEGLRALCGAHGDMELGPSELFQFLSMIQKPQTSRSTYPQGSSTHSSSAFNGHDQSTPQAQKRTRRRVSDRIRSPSDSSGTSSDEDDSAVYSRLSRQTSEPVDGRKAFPAASTAIAPAGGTAYPTRKKTLSDPSRFDSPLAMRVSRGGTAPPSSFGGFARPAPASRRRRGSQSDTEDRTPEPMPSRTGRKSTSQNANVSVTSPTWSVRGQSVPTSPISPGVDSTSFHFRAKSPEEMEQEEQDQEAAELQMEQDRAQEDAEMNNEVEETDDAVGVLGVGGEALNPRLSRISTESTNSLRTSHDKLQALQKQNTDLSRKLKESERQLALLGADNDRLVIDLERQLEEARHELAQKRKDDKELRGHELKQNIQISGLEADLANVQRSLEQSKEHRANMQKMYDSQCDEAQRLRDLLRDRDDEIHRFEVSLADHEADEEKYTRELHSLEADVKRLEAELATARRAESVLETQKQENLQLKETIDRMRFDLDEARAVASNASKGGHGQTGTSASSVGGTLSRNLGDEISRRLSGAQTVMEDSEGEDEDGDSYVETVVTTQRTRKVGNRKSSNSNHQGSGAVQGVSDEGHSHAYADMGTLTDPVEIRPLLDEEEVVAEAGPSTLTTPTMPQDHPPAYSADPDPINEQEVLDRAHPRRHGRDGIIDEEYDTLVEALGVRCNVLEEEIKLKKVEQEKRGTLDKKSTIASRRKSEAGVIHSIVYVTQDALHAHTGKVAMWIVAGFALGVVASSHFMNSSGIHPRDLQLFHTFNTLSTLVQSSGTGEGFLPSGTKGLAGVVAAANMIGVVPT